MSSVDSHFVEQQIDLYEKQVKSWKRERDHSAACRSLEDIVALGLSAYDSLRRNDRNWADDVRANIVPYSKQAAVAIGRLYSRWLKTCQALLPLIDKLATNDHFKVHSSDQLRLAVRQTRGMLSVSPPETTQAAASPKAVPLSALRTAKRVAATRQAAEREPAMAHRVLAH